MLIIRSKEKNNSSVNLNHDFDGKAEPSSVIFNSKASLL